ncbi:MAG: dTMP kinase [Planctomycetes bacterium]|nr:dTMP kinase [Planctomycetota bacterium]
MFIVIEGIDGCGKSTQAKMLVEALRSSKATAKAEVLHLHEPGGTRLGEAMRELLLRTEPKIEISAHAEAVLYNAARAQLVDEVLRPALDAGKHVVCERYFYSTIAYQGYGLQQDTGALHGLCAYATGRLKPDRVVLLDLPAAQSFERMKRGKDRIESRGHEYLEHVRQGYLLLKSREPERFRVVSALGTPVEVHRRIVESLADVLS